MRGSGFWTLSLLQTRQLATFSWSSTETPVHHYNWRALARHLTMPWWPVRSFSNISFLIEVGMTMRPPLSSSSFSIASSLAIEKKRRLAFDNCFGSGHPCQEYFTRSQHTSSCCCFWRISSSLPSVAGRIWVVWLTKVSASSCMSGSTSLREL